MVEIMQELHELGAWPLNMAFVPKFDTLVLYYRVYVLFQRKEPQRKYGYLQRLLADKEVQALLPKDRFGAILWERNHLRMAIREMERKYWV